MAYDSVEGGDPRGSWCPKCQLPVRAGQPATRMHFDSDPYGTLGLSGKLWHAECAQPLWASDSLERLKALGLFDE